MADMAVTPVPGHAGLNPLHGAVWVRYLVRPSFANCRGFLCGLSLASAGLVTEEWLEPGTVVLVELPASDSGEVRSVRGRVCSAEPWGAGRYLLRCRFTTPLNPEGRAATCAQPAPEASRPHDPARPRGAPHAGRGTGRCS
jgi:hypothetical protein